MAARRGLTYWAALFGVCVCVGCSGEVGVNPTSTEPSAGASLAPWVPKSKPANLPKMTDELAMASRQAELDFLADEAGFAEPPTVDIVRWVSLNEWPEVQADCLREAGWPVELQNGAVVMKPLPESQTQAYRQASYICTAKYPVDARQSTKLSPAQNEILYDYYVEWAVPCLHGQGYQTPEPATREVWAAAEFPNSVWDPWSLVPQDDWYSARVSCPLYPDLQYLWS